MSGEGYALACAFLWALSSALIKSQTAKMHIVTLGALRTVPALLIYLVLLLLSDRAGQILELSLRTWVYLVGSSLVGLVLGDLLYFASMKRIGLSRAMPVSATYPFFTMVLAALFLDEQLGWAIVAGAVLIAVGAYLIAFPRASRLFEGDDRVRRKADLAGIVLAIVAAICWGTSTVMVRLGVEGVDITIANSIRLSVLAIVLFAMSLRLGTLEPLQEYGPRSLSIVFAAGILGAGLGTFAFLTAVQQAGAARTSILTATTPLFGVPLSLALKERLSRRMVIGTILTVLGVWLTIQ